MCEIFMIHDILTFEKEEPKLLKLISRYSTATNPKNKKKNCREYGDKHFVDQGDKK